MSAIRQARAADHTAVIDLWERCGLTRPWNDPLADFMRALGFAGSVVLLAETEGAIVGTAMVGFDGHRGWVYYLAVASDHRRQGIARDLLEHCGEWLRQRGCPKVELMVRDSNPDALVYERLGWEAQSVRVYARWLNEEGI